MVKSNQRETIKKILYWLFVIFLIFLIIQLVIKIAGGSLGINELIIALLIANLGYSFHLKDSFSRLESKVSEHLGEHKGYNKARER